MHKTSVYLTDAESARLGVLAKREGRSKAEILRNAIRAYEPLRVADRDFAFIGIAEGPGGSVADIPEEELLEGFGE